jgi:hypothetical protein
LKIAIDRLGRTVLHYILQYDLFECLTIAEFELSNYFNKDFNGDTCIDYISLYNSKNCLKSLLDKFELSTIVKEIQTGGVDFVEKIIV